MLTFYINHLYSLAVFLTFIFCIALINSLSLRKISKYSLKEKPPRVSILVPARNEQGNIEDCVLSLLGQEYQNKEIYVLNDHSSDKTMEILRKIKKNHPELNIIDGKPLPTGWLGKHWACQQLFEQSNGEYILFTDADTRHQAQMLEQAVACMLTGQADMLTAMVTLEIKAWGEGLLVPFMYWSVMSFFPLKLAELLRIQKLSVSVGQFMLFKRAAYQKIGGHAAIKDNIIDDFQLGRNILQHHLKWQFADATDLVDCHMYSGIKNAVNGFAKNFYPVFNYNTPFFVFVFLYLLVVYFEPLLIMIAKLTTGGLDAIPYTPLIASILIAILQQGFVYRRIRIPVLYAFFYPLTSLVVTYTACQSLVSYLTRSATWKERQVSRPSTTNHDS